MAGKSPLSHFFKDLKVVELAGVLAGPSVGLFFAELGAEVTKIENKKTGGDVTRTWKSSSEKITGSSSAYFLSVNFKKKHLFLDVSKPLDHKKCLTLIEKADLVIVNFKKGDAEKLGLSYALLKKINPKLIYAAIHGYSESDPRPAYDLVLQAESGFMSMNGTQKSGPLKMPVAIIDLLAAHHLKEGILMALLKRNSTGIGSHVSVSLFDAAVCSLANQATNYLISGTIPRRLGSLHPNIAPYGETFFTTDKILVTFAIGNNTQFLSLCRVLKIEKTGAQKRFEQNKDRVLNRKQLFEIMRGAVQLLRFQTLHRECLKMNIPCARIRNLEEVFALPEAQQLLRKIKLEGKSFKTVTSVPFHISE